MADLKKTVEIVFGGENELGRTIDDIGKSFGKLDDLASRVAAPLAGIAESILKTDAALMSMAIGGMAYAVKIAGDFNGKFGEITTLISDTGAPIDKFKNDIKSYAVDSVKSIDDINQAIYTAVSAGVDYKDSIKFINEAEKLSVAGRSQLGDTTKMLISTLNAYGESTDKAGKYSDIMFTTVKMGLTTMTELSSSLAQVTGLAANAGIPFETLSAAIAALTTTGMPTAQAITSIKAAIQNIIKPTSEAEKMAASLGLQFNATALKTKGFEGVLWDAQKATGGNVEKMAELFGSVEALNAVMVLAADKTGKFASSLEAISHAAGATLEGYNKVANEFKNINQRLENSFKITLGEIGEKIMPQYGKIAGALGDLMKGIKVGIDSGAFDPLFAYLDKVGTSIANWLNEVAKAFPEALKQVDFSGLASAFADFGKSLGSLFEIGNDKPKEMAGAMQLVVDSIKSLVEVTKGIGEVFVPLIKVAKDMVEGFNALDKSTKELFGNVLGLSLQYKLFGPVVTLIMQGIAADTENGGRNVKLAFLVMENGANAVKVAFISLGMIFATIMQQIAEDSQYLPFGIGSLFGGADAIARTTERVKIIGRVLEEAQNDLASSSMKVQAAWDGADVSATKFGKTVKDTPTKVTTIGEFVPKLDPLATEETRWNLTQAFFSKDKNQIALYTKLQEDEVAAAKAALLTAIPEKRGVTVEVLADGTSIETARDVIMKKFPDGTLYITNIGTIADEARLAETKKKIEDAIPKEKLLEIRATLDVAKIKAASDEIQKAVEWKAKIDIAQVEAETARLKIVFDSINTSITSTGTTLASMIGSVASSVGTGTTGFIQSQIEAEARRRDENLALQKELIGIEIANIKARTALLEKGESIITIKGEGLQPHLEAFMFEILKSIQIRANAEGVKFLVGA